MPQCGYAPALSPQSHPSLEKVEGLKGNKYKIGGLKQRMKTS